MTQPDQPAAQGFPPRSQDLLMSRLDQEDWETLREVLAEHRKRKAVKETLRTWAGAFGIGIGVLIALTQFRDFIKSWLTMK